MQKRWQQSKSCIARVYLVMKILIAAVGKLKQGPELEIFSSYKKRIPWEVEVKEVEEKRNLSDEELKVSEGKLLTNATPSSYKKIVLDERGKILDSREFAKKISSWQNDGYSDFAFLIGGANGHADSVRKSSDLTLSLGNMTWPHMLTRVMLIEQLYRANTILNNHPYHK